MRNALRNYRRPLVWSALASVPVLAALGVAAFGLGEARHLLRLGMAVLAALLVLKAVVVFLTVGVRLLL